MPGPEVMQLLGVAVLALGFVQLCAGSGQAMRTTLVLQAALLAAAALWRGLLAGETVTLLGGLLLAGRAAGLGAGLRRIGALSARTRPARSMARPGARPTARPMAQIVAGLALVALGALLLRPTALPPGTRELAALSLSTALLGLLAAAVRPGALPQVTGLASLGSGVLLAAVVLAPMLLPWLALAVAACELCLLAALSVLRTPPRPGRQAPHVPMVEPTRDEPHVPMERSS